ncbi:DUF6252 family protein [Algibacter sp. AS12]|uniref:DUF6252 family protein n=1 Tax=Algibacter sp. AS12 TaxID=3135773 RepID=UPI00398BA2BB
MKQIFLLFILFSLISCSKDDDDTLTSINNDGTGGMSCLVNGKVLVPYRTGFGNPPKFFGFSNDDDIYYFALGIRHENSGIGDDQNLNIQVYDIDYRDPITFQPISLAGNTYQLGSYGDSNLNGQFQTFGLYRDGRIDNGFYTTTDLINGEVKITYHDIENYIIAGTFWFDAINENGEMVEIRDGRFDIEFTGL